MKKKWELNRYSFWDITGMEQHLEKMARKGWMLEKVSNLGLVYEKKEPQEVRFAVVYTPEHSNFDPGPDEGQETLAEMCAYDGWTLAGQRDQLMVFRNDDPEAVDIDTDPVAQVEGLERVSKRDVRVYWLMLALLGGLLWMTSFSLRLNCIELLSNAAQLVYLLVGLVLLVYVAAELVGWYRWRRKARIVAREQGEFLPTRGNHMILHGAIVLAVLGVVYIALTRSRPGLGLAMLGFGVMYAVIMAVINAVRHGLQKRGAEWHINVMTVGAVALVLVSVFFVGQRWALSELMEPVEKEPRLTAEMLVGEKNEAASFQHQTSWLVSREEYKEGGIGSDFSYLAVDIRLPVLWDMCQEEMMNRYEGWGGRWEYQKTDSAPWQAEEAWQLHRNDKAQEIYLLRWGQRLVEVNFPSGFDQSQREAVVAAFGK